MTDDSTVHLSDESADHADTVGSGENAAGRASANGDSFAEEIERVRADTTFTEPAKRLLDRDKELVERLGR